MVKDQKRAGIVLQYLTIFLSILISLVYSPFMLRMLGQNQYGIYSLATSTIACLSLLSLGLNGSYLRFYSISFKKDKENSVPNLNGLYLFIFSIIGLIALIIGIVLANNVSIFLNETYSDYDRNTAKILFIFLSINIAVSFPGSVFTSYITSQEKFIFLKTINLISLVLSPCANIILLYIGYGSVGMVATTTAITVLTIGVNVFFCFKKIKMKISFKNMDFSLFKDILFFSLFISMNQIIELVNWQTDKIILGKMISGTAVAVYAVGSQINSLFTQFSTAISSVFAPKINMLVEEKPENLNSELTNIFIKVGRVQWFVLTLILSGFIFFGKFFIFKWAGVGYDNSYYVAIILMGPAIVPLIQNIGIEIQRAKNKHHIRSIVYLCVAVLNVVISIFLAKLWGEIGCAVGTAISMILGPILFMNIYYQRKLEINVCNFWAEILKTLPSLLVPFTAGIIVMIFYQFKSIADFIIICFAYSIIYCVCIYLIGINRNEKQIVNGLILRLFHRKAKRNEID